MVLLDNDDDVDNYFHELRLPMQCMYIEALDRFESMLLHLAHEIQNAVVHLKID